MTSLRSFHSTLTWKLLVVVAAAATATCLRASSASLLTLATPAEKKNAIVLEVPAQVLAFQVQILTPTDDWDARVAYVETTRDMLKAVAAQQGLRLVTTQGMRLERGYGGMLASAGKTEIDVKSGVLLLADINDKTDLVDVMQRARLVLTKVNLPKGVRLSIGDTRLGVEDAERFRAELLKKVREHIDLTSGALGMGVEIEVSGLDEPVLARPAGERSVELSLPLKVTYTRKGK